MPITQQYFRINQTRFISTTSSTSFTRIDDKRLRKLFPNGNSRMCSVQKSEVSEPQITKHRCFNQSQSTVHIPNQVTYYQHIHPSYLFVSYYMSKYDRHFYFGEHFHYFDYFQIQLFNESLFIQIKLQTQNNFKLPSLPLTKPQYQYRSYLNSNRRLSYINLIIKAAKLLKCHLETMFIAIDYVDRALSDTDNNLFAIACLFIANKQNEIEIISSSEFLQFLPKETTEKNIFQAELIILRRLNWYLHPRTLYEYVSNILFAFQKYVQQPGNDFQNIKLHIQMPKTIFDKGQNTKYFKYKTEFLDQLYHLMEIVIMDPNYSPKIIQEISFELIYVQFKELVDIEEYFTQFQKNYMVMPCQSTREWIQQYSEIIKENPQLKNRQKIVELKESQTIKTDF